MALNFVYLKILQRLGLQKQFIVTKISFCVFRTRSTYLFISLLFIHKVNVVSFKFLGSVIWQYLFEIEF